MGDLLGRLPEDLVLPVFTHSSWTTRRSESYERLAFLGDSVLALAVTAHLYPRLEADRFGAGRLTKIRAQAVSGRSCRAVAERLGIPERLKTAGPDDDGSAYYEHWLATLEGLVTAKKLAAGAELHERLPDGDWQDRSPSPFPSR